MAPMLKFTTETYTMRTDIFVLYLEFTAKSLDLYSCLEQDNL